MTTTISAWCFRSSMNCWGNKAIIRRNSVFQHHHGRATAALVLRRGFESFHERMVLEKPGYRAAQLASPVSMDDAKLAQIAAHRGIKEAREAREGILNRRADHVQL